MFCRGTSSGSVEFGHAATSVGSRRPLCAGILRAYMLLFLSPGGKQIKNTAETGNF